MEQSGQEEYYLGGDPTHSGFCEDPQQSPGNGSIGKMQMLAVKGKREMKHGGDDDRSSSGSERGGESEDFSSVRRGRVGHRMPHSSQGTKGQQVGSGGDGKRSGSDRGSRGSLKEQIPLMLIRLQDMQNVLQRLHKLETLTASQAKLSLQISN